LRVTIENHELRDANIGPQREIVPAQSQIFAR